MADDEKTKIIQTLAAEIHPNNDSSTKQEKADDSTGGSITSRDDARLIQHEYPTGLKLVLIITALSLAVFLVALDQTIIATAIPRITDRFNSVNDIGWYGSVSILVDLLSVDERVVA
jgi:hypothetical protein